VVCWIPKNSPAHTWDLGTDAGTSWLSASLDCSPASLSCLQNAPEVTTGSLEDTIRQECIKVTVFKATIIHQIPIAGGMAVEATVADIRRRLSEFHIRLPPLMSLGRILEYESDSPIAHIRPLLFYAHLFYLSAMMLLARRIVIIHSDTETLDPPALVSQASQAIEEGYIAEQTAVRLLSLMLAEGRIIQVCWLCMSVHSHVRQSRQANIILDTLHTPRVL
jgi:hypothetical protein